MCPSRGATAEASRIAPITMKRTGKVRRKENSPWNSSLKRKRTPRVVITVGPIKPRMVQRLQVQRGWVLIVRGSSQWSWPPAKIVSEQGHADSDQNQGPHPADADEIEDMKIVQQEQDAQTDQNYGTNWPVLAPGLQRIGRHFSAIHGLGGLHSLERGVEKETA